MYVQRAFKGNHVESDLRDGGTQSAPPGAEGGDSSNCGCSCKSHSTRMQFKGRNDLSQELQGIREWNDVGQLRAEHKPADDLRVPRRVSEMGKGSQGAWPEVTSAVNVGPEVRI